MMVDCEGLLQAKHKFEMLFTGDQAHLTPEHHHYLALIVIMLSSRLQQQWVVNICGIEQLVCFWK